MNNEPRTRSKTDPFSLTAAQRQVRAVKLRQQGYGYREIARKLDCSLGTAHKYVADALAEIRDTCKEEAQVLRELEIAKLDEAERLVWQSLRKQGNKPAEVAMLAGSIKSLSESRRKLTGLDAPVKLETSGNLYTVLQASPDCPAWDKPESSGA